jgi:hypothetical protein
MDDMNANLISLLRANMGVQLDPNLAADIMVLADQIPTLVPFDVIDRIIPEVCGEFTFAVERIEDIEEEIKPLHRAHWDETETARHGLPFNPDYQTFTRYERAGRYVLFTLRQDDRLLGNCAMYLDRSAHTQTLIATEDTLYLLPEARKGRIAMRFVGYVEESLRQLGVREIEISVKVVNKAGKFFAYLGYKQREVGLTKVLE